MPLTIVIQEDKTNGKTYTMATGRPVLDGERYDQPFDLPSLRSDRGNKRLKIVIVGGLPSSYDESLKMYI